MRNEEFEGDRHWSDNFYHHYYWDQTSHGDKQHDSCSFGQAWANHGGWPRYANGYEWC